MKNHEEVFNNVLKRLNEQEQKGQGKLIQKNQDTPSDSQRWRRRLLFAALPAACFCIVLTAVLLPFLMKENEPRVTVVNPIAELDSVSDLEKALDVSLPVPAAKTAARCLLFSAKGEPFKGEIDFTDGTVLAIGTPSETKDISGIYGGVFVGSADIRGVAVQYYCYSGVGYAIFSCQQRPYCYYVYAKEQNFSAENINEVIGNDVKNIISLILDNKDERNSK